MPDTATAIADERLVAPTMPDSTAPDPRARIAQQVNDERVATLYALTATPVLAGMCFACLVTVILWPHRPAWLMLAWLTAKIAVGYVRVDDTRRFMQTRPTGEAVTPWARRALVMLVADGLIWGSMGVLFMPADAPAIRAVMLAALVGIAGVGVFSYVSDSRGSVLFLFSLLLPAAIYEAHRNTSDGWFASLGIVIYLGMMCLEAKRSEVRVIEMLRLRFENAWIADERHRAMLLSEHANAAKSRFLAAVSHEMRTPLNGIMGMAQVLQRSALDTEQRAQVGIIASSSRHLQSVIGDLLDLSRIEFGKLVFDERAFALRDMVDEVAALLQPVAEEKGLRFALAFDSRLPAEIVGDPSRIKQVLHNLLGNAIKFTSQGHVRLTVDRVDVDPQEPVMLRFGVQDSGEGVPAALAERIFDAFEQGPTANTRGRLGTGLGLTISRRLARAMGGDVVCEIHEGRGARFAFAMPLCLVPTSSHVAADPADTPNAPQDAPLSPLPALAGRVLVVDDNPVNALVASAMLERAGLAADVVEDGLSAVQRMQAGGYDLVLMDCQLPVLDGWQATRRYRAVESPGRRLPIIAVTANAVRGDRERCLQAGMDDYIAKPVEIEALLDTVRRHLGNGSIDPER